MPLAISEIGIRMAVGDGPAPAAEASQSDAADASGAGAPLSPAQAEDIVTRCVQQVLATLRMREER